MPKVRSAVLNIALLGLTLSVAFALGEVGIRVWHARTPVRTENNPSGSTESWIIPDPDLGYRLRPSVGVHNADGLWGAPVPTRSGKLRVLMLGDSLIYGSDNFVLRAADILANDTGLKPSEFLNAGVPGYTNYQELMFLKKRGLAFQPDVVGVVFVLNDLHKFLHAPRFEADRLVGDTFWKRSDEVASNTLLDKLSKRSQLLAWMRQKFLVTGYLAKMVYDRGYTFDHNPDFRTAWMDESWPVIEAQLREIVDLGQKSGFRVFLVAIPFAEQLRKDYMARDAAYVTKPQRYLREICGRLQIPYLDLLPFLNRQLFVPDLVHLTPGGRDVAGQQMASFLKEQGLIPSAQR